jgi:Lon protease-like protein
MPGEHLPIFPLNTVLFPGGLLALRIFEQRYLAMTKACLRDGTGFGVCLISEGREVGGPAMPSEVGCVAHIEHWDMPQLGIFELRTRGVRRFRLLSTRVAQDGLLLGEVALLDAEPVAPVAERHAPCARLARELIERLGEEYPPPHHFQDASWLSYRLVELLPVELLEKQRLLVSNDATARLDRVLQMIESV